MDKYWVYVYIEIIKMSVMSADSIKQNKDRDRLVKGCFQFSKTIGVELSSNVNYLKIN